MRKFDYKKYVDAFNDSELWGLVSGIHEYKGKQEMYLAQKPATLEKLVEVARTQSTESSNAIEGIWTSDTRLRKLVQEKTTPQNRAEEEIAGYRYVLNEIHESYEYIPITSNYILQLHRDLYRFTNLSFGGKFKIGQNQIVARDADGKETVLFTPTTAFDTPAAIEAICKEYNSCIENEIVDPLILTPIFIHDFLCIHPFSDGNGRMSRLLTTLMLYRSGYVVGRYISLEKKIADDKELYYDALSRSQDGWHEANENPLPFIKYVLQTIIAAYKDFQERMLIVEGKKSAKEQVREAVFLKIGKFTKSEIMELCPGIGKASVENALTALVQDGIIKRYGTGRGTYYVRADAGVL